MKFIVVTDEQGFEHQLNPAYILDVKARPSKAELGSVIKFSNGNSLTVIEGVPSVIKQITGVPPVTYIPSGDGA